jgi:Leucine-rich repeat (LRR) protein
MLTLACCTRQVLSLYQNSIKQLPDGIGSLKFIEMLCLGDNLLDESGLAAFEVRATLGETAPQLLISHTRINS